MKHILIFIFLVSTVVSQRTIEGHVIDSSTKEPLGGAKLTLLTIHSIKLDSTYELNDFLTKGESKPVYYYDTSWKNEKIAYTNSLGYYNIANVEPNNYKCIPFSKSRTKTEE